MNPQGEHKFFALTCTPFGWDFIPSIANTIIHNLLDAYTSPLYHQLIYYDDHLGIANSIDDCVLFTNKVCNAIEGAGFVIHPAGSDKTTTLPNTSSHFIGKNIISGTSPAIFNADSTLYSALFACIVGTSYKLQKHQLQSIIGTLLWFQAHNKFGKLFLYGADRLCTITYTNMF